MIYTLSNLQNIPLPFKLLKKYISFLMLIRNISKKVLSFYTFSEKELHKTSELLRFL
jgi:hypothetical protein